MFAHTLLYLDKVEYLASMAELLRPMQLSDLSGSGSSGQPAPSPSSHRSLVIILLVVLSFREYSSNQAESGAIDV